MYAQRIRSRRDVSARVPSPRLPRARRRRNRSLRLEMLERRDLLSALSDGAYAWMHDAVVANERDFYIYQDADSGFNHGVPSGIFPGSMSTRLKIDTACIHDASTADGCSSDPNRLDVERGTVLRLSFPALAFGEFVGLNIEEPEGWSNLDGTAQNQLNGYDLRGAERLLLDARAIASGPFQVRLEIGGRSTAFFAPPAGDELQPLCVDLTGVGQAGCLALNAPPNLADVNVLVTVVTERGRAPQGGTLLLDNIRLDPPPVNPTGGPRYSLPVGNTTHGAVDAKMQVRDDQDADFSSTGDWSVRAGEPAFGSGDRVAAAGDSIASWRFTDLPPRVYVVQATWVAHPGNATNVLYTLDNEAGQTVAVHVDQTRDLAGAGEGVFAGRGWRTLGEIAVTSDLTVELAAAGADGFVVADAVRLVPTIPPDQAVRNLATVYESAMAVMALLDRGLPADLQDARHIADALVYALAHDVSGPTQLPLAADGWRGLRDSYSSGELAWFNSNGSTQAGQIRLAGFSSDARLCAPPPYTEGDRAYCLVLDGAYGGNNAFAIMALVQAYWRFGDQAYLTAASEIGQWIHDNLVDRNGPLLNDNPATQT